MNKVSSFIQVTSPSILEILITKEDVNELTHTGEILRRRDGNYCFSCNHCDEYFDVLQDIIAHINKVLNDETEKIFESKFESGSYTEFVDVTAPVDVEFGNDIPETNVSCEGNENDYVEKLSAQNIISNRWKQLKPAALLTVNTSAIESKVMQDCERQSNTVVNAIRHKSQIRLNEKYAQPKSMKCCWCSATFNDLASIQNHLTDDHNKKPSNVYQCDDCHTFYKNLKLLSVHILTEHGAEKHEQFQLYTDYQENEKPIQCTVCQSWLNGTKAFDVHTKEVHKMYRILQCYVCGIFKKKPSGLIEHLKVHDRFRKYRCYECDNVEPKITNPNDLRSHKCVLCGVWFWNHTTIRNHMNDVHGQDQIYDCTICDNFTFKTDKELKMHSIEAHDISPEFKCTICSRNCKSMQSLSEHKQSHSVILSENICSICGSKFQRKDYLVRHIKSHGQVTKDFKCYICKKAFQSNGYLKNHIKRHTETKIHQCDVCGVRFLLAGLLRKHMKEHEGEVWKCTQCPKEFSNKSKLTAHEKTHIKERNFRCEVS